MVFFFYFCCSPTEWNQPRCFLVIWWYILKNAISKEFKLAYSVIKLNQTWWVTQAPVIKAVWTFKNLPNPSSIQLHTVMWKCLTPVCQDLPVPGFLTSVWCCSACSGSTCCGTRAGWPPTSPEDKPSSGRTRRSPSPAGESPATRIDKNLNICGLNFILKVFPVRTHFRSFWFLLSWWYRSARTRTWGGGQQMKGCKLNTRGSHCSSFKAQKYFNLGSSHFNFQFI